MENSDDNDPVREGLVVEDVTSESMSAAIFDRRRATVFDRCLQLQFLAGTVMDIEHDDIVITDSKDDAIFVFPFAVEQLTDFKGNLGFSAASGQREGWRVSVSIGLKRP
jgi:hypothetical protein